MDSKDGKKKESIDEILSDLNGLLNKMPSILDGIRMPEIKPVDFDAPAPKPGSETPSPVIEQKQEAPVPVFNAEKTVVLEPFSGLPEGSSATEVKPAAPEALAIESFPKLVEGLKQADTGGLVPQSLGDFMFGEDAQEEKPAPAAAVKLSGAPLEPPAEQPPAREPGEELPKLSVSPLTPPEAKAPDAELIPATADLKPRNVYENTRDFGVPDIDALMQLSQEEILGKPEKEPAPEPEAAKEESSMDELAEFERQLKVAGEEGAGMEDKAAEHKSETPSEAIVPEAAPVEQAAVPGTGFEGLTIEPVAEVLPEAPPEVSAENNLSQSVQPETQPEPAAQAEPAPQPESPAEMNLGVSVQAENTLQLEPARQQETRPEPSAQAETPAEPELSVGTPADKSFGTGPAQGMVLEPASAAFSGQPEPGAAEETLVVPPASPAGDEGKTVIYEVGAAPGSTFRSKAGDFDTLAVRQSPEGIPEERVRSIMFLYSPEEKGLCASVMAELDAICLKSPSKPMFVRRAMVRECTADMNANYILQMASDSGAVGLVCVGAIPQEKIYEVENVFTSSGNFFRHYDSSSFNHSVALDLVSDLILRV